MGDIIDLVMIRELKSDAETQITRILNDYMNETGLDVDELVYDVIRNPLGQVVSYHIRIVSEV